MLDLPFDLETLGIVVVVKKNCKKKAVSNEVKMREDRDFDDTIIPFVAKLQWAFSRNNQECSRTLHKVKVMN